LRVLARVSLEILYVESLDKSKKAKAAADRADSSGIAVQSKMLSAATWCVALQIRVAAAAILWHVCP
jgi:hypothetical protein